MTPQDIRGTVAQILTFVNWALIISGHNLMAGIIADPNTATEIATLISAGFAVWGIAEHLIAAYQVKSLKAKLPASPPPSLTQE